ncbi:hypothetical protein AJ80_00475 [Polytolypa hystricis UAMH7299]|uniref:Fcf2 pre-rRNA processing C-terminal domain-containing protein n=1 Tax=Polytolypa hystricis (strain UAMH7299) TaxID=1447883 RepID=A0A2B7Z2T6_POLH7|nr:hypothetical protein AJ80_00475 [Polytolypa hystricis UAMH7299]
MSAALAQAPVPQLEETELSDEQIQKLLQEAEARLLQSVSVVSDSLTQADSNSKRGPNSLRIPTLDNYIVERPYVSEKDNIATIDKPRVVPASDKKLADTIRTVVSEAPGPSQDNNAKPTSGPEWFNLPKTDLTPQLKRDLQLLRMRSVLDPKRHYKKDNGKFKPPEYSQVGTIVEGPTEFFSARISNKDRRKTFVEEALSTETSNGRFKRKYGEIQDAKTSGRKAHYKSLKGRRTGNKKFG